ncbi:cation diffusion facilitator family transporter [uncultured Sunxiuqinia sp.]|uniref:cation diffusion facilitator family transporter n=1 Tax=uncultured Sunxiuqinia sp. TaxID=1573825 RepID=UPI0030D6F005|tara:strand:- start:9023 stop:9916 length:894 start_codon:yes stop_codon:yes gene_type:complete
MRNIRFNSLVRAAMTHEHAQNRLGITIFLNVVITVAQIIGGIISGSLALISDALHNLSDSLAVVLAYIANRLSGREKTSKSTFGFQRAEIIAAFINALVLVVISFYLMVEAIKRYFDPQVIDFRWMLWLGILGIAANGFSVFLLHADQNHNLNIKAAYLHLMGDAMTSVAVVVGALCIWLWDWYWIDPTITLLISFYLLLHTYKLLKESTEILMQFAPSNISVPEIARRLTEHDQVAQVYHIHVWRLTDRTVHFEAHVVLNSDLKLSETKIINKQLAQILIEEFEIQHITLQLECVK